MPVAVVTEATGSFRPSTPLLSMSICLCHENNPKRGMKKKSERYRDVERWRDFSRANPARAAAGVSVSLDGNE